MGNKDAIWNINLKIDSLECDKELIDIKLKELKAERKRIKQNGEKV